VDDNAAVRRLIKSIVQRSAEEIRECEDGEDALAAYEALWPDLVFMDIRMKRVDGIQATRQIRAAHPGAKIVIVSDYDDTWLREAALDAGACGYELKDNLPDLIRLLGIPPCNPHGPGAESCRKGDNRDMQPHRELVLAVGAAGGLKRPGL